MKKFKFYLTWMGLMMALGVMAQPAGNGSKESPFLLGTAEDMSWFRTYVYDTDAKACAKLTADIDLSSAGTWMGIGTEMRPYQGVFDGDGHRIKGVNMNFANVSKWSGLDPDKPIAGHDANTYIAIVKAMTRMENGGPLPSSPGGGASDSLRPYSEEWMMEQMAERWRLANQ